MLTISEAFALYAKKSALRESSIEIKERACRYFIEAAGDLPVDSVGFAEAEDYKVWLAHSRSARAANIYLANLKPFFGWLVKRGYIKENPFDSIGLYETGDRQKQVYEPAEIEKVLRVADLRWQVITLLGLCGLRRSEVLNLTVADLCFEKKYLRVQAKKDTGETWEWRIKNSQEAIAPMPETFNLPDMVVNLHAALRQLIADLPFGQPYIVLSSENYQRLIRLKREGQLTHRQRGCPWQNFTRDWSRLLKRASVKRLRFHDLRGTCATALANSGASLTDTQRVLRQRSPQTTARYYISVDESKLVETSARVAQNYYATVVS